MKKARSLGLFSSYSLLAYHLVCLPTIAAQSFANLMAFLQDEQLSFSTSKHCQLRYELIQ